MIEFFIKETNCLTDKLNMPLDNGIKYIVAVLRYNEFQTVGSCEGHLNWGLSYPWVDIDQSNLDINIKSKNDLLFCLNKSKTNENLFIENIGIFGAFRLRGHNLFDLNSMNNLADFLLK